MSEQLQHNFVLGNMATDLVAMSLNMCGKDDDKNPRFPRLLYSSYVKNIINTSLKIHEYLCVANGITKGKPERTKYQKAVMSECVHLEALIGIALNNRWISQKQHDRWTKLVTDIHWRTYNWLKI